MVTILASIVGSYLSQPIVPGHHQPLPLLAVSPVLLSPSPVPSLLAAQQLLCHFHFLHMMGGHQAMDSLLEVSFHPEMDKGLILINIIMNWHFTQI